MKINLDNIIKNWKVFLIIIFLCQLFMLLVFKIFGIEKFLSLTDSEWSIFFSTSGFLFYIHWKKDN